MASVSTLPVSTRVVSNAARCAAQIVRAERRAAFASSDSATVPRNWLTFSIISGSRELAEGRASIAVAPRVSTLASEPCEPVRNCLPLRSIRHATRSGLQVLARMRGAARSGQDDRDRGVAEHPLEEELRGARDAESRRHGRQGLARGAVDHRALREGSVDQYRDAELARGWQEPGAGIRLRERVVHLHEVRSEERRVGKECGSGG